MKCILIKPSSISHLEWCDPDYINKVLTDIIEIDFIETEFFNIINNLLETNKYDTSNKIEIINHKFDDEPYYNYNILYINLNHHNNIKNEVATLLTTNNADIYSNAIIIKEHAPSLKNDTFFTDINKDDLIRLLNKRINFNFITWDDKFNECSIPIASFKDFITTFFDDEEPEIKHIDFLMHNIHIMYIKVSNGNKYSCGNLLSGLSIDKYLVYATKSQVYYDNLTLDEFNKIIKLSEKISSYTVSETRYFDDFNTKYRTLDEYYNQYYV